MKEKLDNLLKSVLKVNDPGVLAELSMDNYDRWDSLTHMDLIATLEENFSFAFTMEEIMEMRDVKSIRRVVESKSF